jgi:hypothetical protein
MWLDFIISEITMSEMSSTHFLILLLLLFPNVSKSQIFSSNSKMMAYNVKLCVTTVPDKRTW